MSASTISRGRNVQVGPAPDMKSRVLQCSPILPTVVATALVAQALVASAYGQGRGGPPPGPPPTAKALAPYDLTGYWVSVVTEDWRYRMVPPAKGDYQAVPINPEGRKLADAWDPAKDEAAGNQCKYYGAAALMRIPGYLHITWQDDNTLKIETDAGTQTRILHFGNGKSPAGERSWQGDTVATWEVPRGRGPAPVPAPYGTLKAVTTNLKAGYLRKNGVPYSENTVLTEYST